jgi:HK97 family phage major capsid protein
MENDIIQKIGSQVDGIVKQNESLLTNYNNLDTATMAAMEELTKLKNAQASQGDILASMQKLQRHLTLESRAAFGSAAARIARDPEKRTVFLARLAKSLGIEHQASDAIKAVCKDLDEANTPGSTYIANAEVERDIYTLLASYGAFRNVDVRMIGTKTSEVRLKTARVAAIFVDEAATISADSTKAGSKTALTPKKIAALISVSSELLMDDVGGLVEDVLNDLAEAIAYRIDWITFAATGTADSADGSFTGMFTGGTARTAASGNVSVATLDYEDVLACVTNLPVGLLQRGTAKWFINPTIIAKLLLIKDGNGRPIFNTAIEAPSYGSIGTILGFPVIPVAAAPSTDSTSKLLAAFGDPMAMAVRIRQDITYARSEQWAFDTDEISFRATCRAGAAVKTATAFQVLKTAAS